MTNRQKIAKFFELLDNLSIANFLYDLELDFTKINQLTALYDELATQESLNFDANKREIRQQLKELYNIYDREPDLGYLNIITDRMYTLKKFNFRQNEYTIDKLWGKISNLSDWLSHYDDVAKIKKIIAEFFNYLKNNYPILYRLAHADNKKSYFVKKMQLLKKIKKQTKLSQIKKNILTFSKDISLNKEIIELPYSLRVKDKVKSEVKLVLLNNIYSTTTTIKPFKINKDVIGKINHSVLIQDDEDSALFKVSSYLVNYIDAFRKETNDFIQKINEDNKYLDYELDQVTLTINKHSDRLQDVYPGINISDNKVLKTINEIKQIAAIKYEDTLYGRLKLILSSFIYGQRQDRIKAKLDYLAQNKYNILVNLQEKYLAKGHEILDKIKTLDKNKKNTKSFEKELVNHIRNGLKQKNPVIADIIVKAIKFNIKSVFLNKRLRKNPDFIKVVYSRLNSAYFEKYLLLIQDENEFHILSKIITEFSETDFSIHAKNKNAESNCEILRNYKIDKQNQNSLMLSGNKNYNADKKHSADKKERVDTSQRYKHGY